MKKEQFVGVVSNFDFDDDGYPYITVLFTRKAKKYGRLINAIFDTQAKYVVITIVGDKKGKVLEKQMLDKYKYVSKR